MTDLSGKLEGNSNDSIASYFSLTVESVEIAIAEGAKTYQDVYDFKLKVKQEIKKRVENKPKSTMIELVTELEAIPVKCEEIEYMINEARSGEYHDAKNRKYACGKRGFCSVAVAFGKRNPLIVEHLKPLVEAINNGDYDEPFDDIDNKKMSNDIMKDTTTTMRQKDHLHKMAGLNKPKSKSPFGKQYF